MRKMSKAKRHSFADTYKFPDGKPASKASAADWERSARLHDREANRLWRLSERCLHMAESLRRTRRKHAAPGRAKKSPPNSSR